MNIKYVIRSVIGLYVIEVNGVAGFSEWRTNAKEFDTAEEAQSYATEKNLPSYTWRIEGVPA